MAELILREECYQVVGACLEVVNDKGCGFLESVYQECLEIEFNYQKLPHVPRQKLRLFYRQQELKQKFIPDFVCFDQIIVEIKAVSQLTDAHRSQVINYLNASDFRLGLLINFGSHPRLEWERFVHTNKRLIAEMGPQ
jgi:GxxExxY protein